MRVAYGEDPSQWVEVTEPVGESRGLVFVIHGGFWKAEYDASLGAPLAADLALRGWTAANVEYRRVGNGGGFPHTCDDIDAAINLTAPGHERVITLGHSAGGHLAVWAAARHRFDRWRRGARITHALSQAGVLDLTTAAHDGLGSGAVERLMSGGPDNDAYARADPTRHLPLDLPVWCLHARDDEDVPFSQSEDYVAASATATLVEVTGGHFDLVDPSTDAWAAVLGVLDEISPRSTTTI